MKSMTPADIAQKLTDGTDLAAAALLVALCEDDELIIEREHIPLLEKLERLGCVKDGEATNVGRRVAILLQAKGIRPEP